MIIRKLRLEQGWTQQQLAEHSGLSIRTVQRIEKGQAPSEESAKCFAAVFQVEAQDILDFYATNHPTLNDQDQGSKEDTAVSNLKLSVEEEMAMREVDKLKEFYQHALSYAVVIPTLWLINWYSSSESWWAIWPTLGWGIGLAFHAIMAFNVVKLFGPEWERREIQKRLNNKQ